MAKKIAVILSGCGVFDGSEIYETTLTLLHLQKRQADITCYAPDINQHHIINHNTGNAVEGTRSVLEESARLARGEVMPLGTLKVDNFDAIIFPGGFGGAKNLSNFALEEQDENLKCDPAVERVVQNAFEKQIPLGFICITPASVAAIALKGKGVKLTVGNDEDIAKRIENLGNLHVNATVHDIVTDTDHKVVSTPAYMLAQNIPEAESGIQRFVEKILEMAGEGAVPRAVNA